MFRRVSTLLISVRVLHILSVLLSSKDFYLSSIPTLISEHLDLKGSWSSHAKILIGKIISISESFQVSDIQSFACTNKRCRNNQKVIRHVGLNHLEQVEELGPSGTTPEVFISSTGRSKAKISIKCHNCREEIEELYPFRSNLEFKIAKVNVDGGSSCFPIDILLAGSMACKAVKLSNEYSFIGYPRLAAELSHQLKHAKGLLGPFYFEVYGADPLICYETTNDFIKPALNWLISRTNEKLRFCLLLLICQVIGATNGIHFDLCLPGIDDRVINKIYKLFNVLFNYNNNNNNKIMGIVHLTSSKLSKQKTLHVSEQIYPFHVNIVNEKLLKNIPIAGSSFLYTNGIPNDQLVIIPIDLSLNEEADILLKTTIEQDLPKIQLPAQNSQLHLSEVCVKSLQSYFLRLRSKTNNLPMKFSLSLLTKLSQISALNHNKLEADEGDADFAIMIHAKLVESAFEFESSFDYQSQEIDCIDYIMSPSITFDDSIDLSCEKNHPKRLKDYYGII